MKRADYEFLKSQLAPMLADREFINKHTETIKNDPRVKDQAMRLRWDLFWIARDKAKKAGVMVERDVAWDFYSRDLNDAHIDTALKAIVSESR